MRLISLALVVAAAVLVPISAFAQEAVISGNVKDTTGGVLPGVALRAVNQASGNNFEAVTDSAGAFRIPLRVGVYEVTAELSGFTTATRSGLEVLVGQQVSISFQLSPSTIQETVTVTVEAPLIETTSSSMSANIDPRQMTDLPINGRNWQDLLAVAPGARYNSQQRGDSVSAGEGTFQLNLDGQQVTQTFAGSGSGFGQPRFSQDAIAEVEYVSNRFDATQGRSMGVQVNAITKSGTNTLAATFAGFFRDESMNAKDHVANTVLPYSNQQLSATVGGPIIRDRLHFFFATEYEREPYSSYYNTPVPAFNLTVTETRTEKKSLLRLDGQFSPQTRLSVRGSIAHPYIPNESLHGSGTATPNGAVTNDQKSQQLQAVLTRVMGSRAVNELKAGFNHYTWLRSTQTLYKPTSFLSRLVPDYESQFTPLIAPKPLIVNFVVNFTGLSNGGSGQPQTFSQEDHSLRDDLTMSFTAKGRHDVKTGGEVFSTHHWGYVCQNCVGTIDAQGGPMPSPQAMAGIFPDLYDVSTWRLDLIPTSIIRRFQQAIGPINEDVPRWDYGLWLQDDWKVGSRLTLNLGVRYDRANKANANDTEILPFLPKGRGDDTNNVAPRLGFAYSLTPETVIRGGAGKYFAEVPSIQTLRTVRAGHLAVVVINNDGRPDFAVNPYNGSAPKTYEEALRIVRERNLQTSLSGLVANPSTVPYSYQTSIGVQHQLAATTAVQADYVYRGVHDDMVQRNLNLSYDPATGVNYPNTDRTRLPYPQFSTVGQLFPDGYSNYHALQTAITRRLAGGWQASGTYTLAYFRDGYSSPAPQVPNLAPDLGPQYGLAVTDQRHRAVFNGIWQTRYGIQLSGIYFFGSGERLPTTYGGDGRRSGGNGDQLRPDGTLVPRNNFVGNPIHRVDIRLQKRLNLGRRVKLDGMFEVFNVFNHANYGAYITEEGNRNYGQPTQTPGFNFGPRMLQLGFRTTF